MKTRINLYSDSLFPKQHRLSFDRLALFSVAALVIMLLIGVFTSWQASQALAEVRVAERELSQTQQTHNDLKDRVKAHAPRPELVEQVNRRERQLAMKQLLIRELNERSRLTSTGFSPLMKDLASVHRSDLWLTQIYASEGKFRFEGGATMASSLPKWVDQLQTTETLRGQSFHSMTMQSQKNQALSFVLSSLLDEGAQ
ncbi:PilN domain-containing protein [Paraferrimonas sedimenticola]|uniref:Fimbrial assembly protein (PilN) n=1 Tax=Paraferrimonas sedimenticola TaxID=375674 RepID=A0AA37RY45_9GAMM|nr:PilN domain-containing protein [Paraferrimonas sedimenticola]GLP97395.1 hypothetical protein GCM10007895_27020 [Paraferrimonas sedimenticola]